jgi:outer membrane receptor protein involved in Fe transport
MNNTNPVASVEQNGKFCRIGIVAQATVRCLNASIRLARTSARLLPGMGCLRFSAAWLLAGSTLAWCQISPPASRIQGSVLDPTGAPVSHAQITLVAGSDKRRIENPSNGKFLFENVASAHGMVRVESAGFVTRELSWTVSPGQAATLDVTLQIAGPAQQVIVSATRTATTLEEATASVNILDATELSSTAALTLDDALRQVAGFTLFRRSGSRTTNPTAQGVSLRGVGPSGASRALVLFDGLPLNDPFGGWVYWDRVPRTTIAAVETMKGGASSLYGSTALGGVVNILGKPLDAPHLALETSWGSQSTPDLALTANGNLGKWHAAFSGQAQRSNGYVIVDDRNRGAIDTPASSEFRSGTLSVERKFRENTRLFALGSVFGESRHNGTPFQLNNTRLAQLALGGDWDSPIGTLQLRAAGGGEIFNQNFSAIATDRNSETPTRTQRVPSTPLFLSAQWSHALGSRQLLVAGLEAQDIRGHSAEVGYIAGLPASHLDAGGRQRTIAFFGEDIVRLGPRWQLTASARVDRWRNFNGFTASAPLASPSNVTSTLFPERTETAFSPRAGLMFRARSNLSFSAAAYRSFRAPTLNELYRAFRVGSVLTLANTALRAERLTGGEAGATYSIWDQRLLVRGTFFWSDISDPVANVTLTVTPALITRQRQNLGSTRSRGLELQAEGRLSSHLAISGAYQYVSATVLDFAADPSLIGRDVPQTPRHQFTFQFRGNMSHWTFAVQGRTSGRQFDDDQNLLPLDSYFNLDAYVSRALGHNVELFGAMENVLNQRYQVGRTPIITLGPPILARVGLRLTLGKQ